MKEKRTAVLGEPIASPQTGFSQENAQQLRALKVLDSSSQPVAELETRDSPEWADKQLAKAGYTRLSPWSDGQAEVEKMTWVFRHRWKIMWISLPVLIAASGALSAMGPEDEPEADKYGARIDCEERVRERLNDPQSGSFSAQSELQVGQSWTSRGTVRAANAFGGYVTGTYTCQTTYDPSDESWTGTVSIEDQR